MKRLLVALAACSALSGCAASTPPPPTTPSPTAAGDTRIAPIGLATDWTGRVVLDRRDSIVITMANGTRQLQRQGQFARFDVEVQRGGELRIRLDTLAFNPAAGATTDVIGTTWTGTLGRTGVSSLRPSKRSAVVDELTTTLQGLFPAIPNSGVRPGTTWSDTSESRRRVQAFEAKDYRTANWRGGARTTREGLVVQPVTAVEHFEQLGEAETGGQKMTMTAQGRRSSVYYLSVTGRIEAVTHADSVAMLITIPARRETIPTMQQIRTTFRFLPPR